jgi:hypothetical protein
MSNYSNGRMWDDYDKALSRITDLEEERDTLRARAEQAEAALAAINLTYGCGDTHIAIVFDGDYGDSVRFKRELEQLFDEALKKWRFSRTGSSAGEKQIVLHYHLPTAYYGGEK